MKLYNTLTRNLDEFKPQDPDRVTLYTCGPTVYNYLHVGNWVAYLRWDTLVRALRASSYKVERVMNITDVGHLTSDADEGEDKMEKGAKREGKTAWDIAKIYTDDFMAGMEKLNLLAPEHVAKATDHIAEQIELVKTLEAKGYIYKIDDGIYYDTSKFSTYADFAKLDLDQLKAGARVEMNPQKRGSSDFALWKFTPVGQTRDMEWGSPWGKGFPGWHLECSAMAMRYLGETLDIHTGGIDHIPVHHTNEIAQSEAATGKRFANHWLHANHMMVDGTKISKSLDNGYTLQQLEEQGFWALDFRMFVLQSHYRTQANFTWEGLGAAQNRLKHWQNVAVLRWQTHENTDDSNDNITAIHTAEQAVLLAMQDDLNTPQALKEIEEIFSQVEKNGITDTEQRSFEQLLKTIDELLGLKLLDMGDIGADIKNLIADRQTARDTKDWGKADKIRDHLEANGITVRDTVSGPIWSKI